MTFDGYPWAPVPGGHPPPTPLPGDRPALAFLAATTAGLAVVTTALLGLRTGPGMGPAVPTAGRAALAGLAGTAVGAALATAALRRFDPGPKAYGAVAAAGFLVAVPLMTVVMLVVLRGADLTTTQVTLLAAAIGAGLSMSAACMACTLLSAVQTPPDPAIRTSAPSVARSTTVVLSLAVIGLLASPTTLTGAELDAIRTDAEADIARQGLLTEDDLGPDWTEIYDGRNEGDNGGPTHICGSPGDLPLHVTGWSRHFSLDLSADGKERGNIWQSVLVAPTVADAVEEFSAVGAPGYQSCTEAAVARDTGYYALDAIGEPEVTFSRQVVPGLEHGVVDRLVATYPTAYGTNVIHVAFVRMQRGRAIVRLPVMTHNHNLSDRDLMMIVDAASERLSVVATKLGPG